MENGEFFEIIYLCSRLFCQLQEHHQEIIFPFSFIDPISEIAMKRHFNNRLAY